jgi:hypothetical protein
VADDVSSLDLRKQNQIKAAVSGLKQVKITWFPGAAHDIHIDQPAALTARFLEFSDQYGD